MQFKIYRDEKTQTVNFEGSYTETELKKLQFNTAERDLILQPTTNGADILLMLELIFRKSAEHLDNKLNNT